jgi:phosphatidylglycerol:prolipoprotein diacylglycerol transferase
MYQTLFAIPRQIAGIDVFGFGWLLGIWAIASVAIVGWSLYRHGWGAETRGQIIALAIVGFAIAVVLPALIKPEGLLIRGYGVMLMLAVVSGVGLCIYRAHQKGVDPEIILSLAMWLFVAGFIGARLFYVVEYWDQFQRPTLGETVAAIINLTEGGLVVFGSMLAGGAALIVFVYKYKLPGLALSDLIAPGVVLGAAIGRIGCFLNGCCYGGVSDVPWAVMFPPGTPAYNDQAVTQQLYLHGLRFQGSGGDPAVIAAVEAGSPAAKTGLKAGDRLAAVNGAKVDSVETAQFALLSLYRQGESLRIDVAGERDPKRWTIATALPPSKPMHPAQLYSFIDGALLCFFLLAYEPYKRRDGELTAWVLTIHPVARFLLEIVRVDESPVFHTGLSISQNISIALFVAGIGLWIYLLRRPVGLQWPARMAVAPS